MIQKTPEEKAKLKLAKSAYKQANKVRVKLQQQIIEKKREENSPILTGLLENEHPLPDDYLVYMDYYYVTAKAGVFNVVRSDIKGNIAQLRRDLQKIYKIPIGEIFNCDLVKRNLL